MSNFVSKVSVN